MSPLSICYTFPILQLGKSPKITALRMSHYVEINGAINDKVLKRLNILFKQRVLL